MNKKMNRKMNRNLIRILLCLTFFWTSMFMLLGEISAEEKSEIKSSYILLEASTMQPILSENANAQLPMASLTKTMALLIFAEEISKGNLKFDDVVPVSAYASSVGGSVIWLESGEQMTAGDMIKSVVISSANDATVALAEYISGSEAEFVARMNKKVDMMGLKNTNFTGCIGFDDENHYSSSYDMAIIFRELIKYDYFNEFFGTRLDSVRTGTERETQLLNTNKLGNYYDGHIAGKTGTTDKAGYCLSVAAKRNDMVLIAVTLGAKSDEKRIEITENLLDTGFSEYKIYTPEIAEELLLPIKVKSGVTPEIKIQAANDIKCIIKNGDEEKIDFIFDIPETVDAPILKGQSVGMVTLRLHDSELLKTDIIATNDSEKLTLKLSIIFLLKSFFNL